jgi:hypothetical protein
MREDIGCALDISKIASPLNSMMFHEAGRVKQFFRAKGRRSWSDSENDFAELAILLEVAMGLDHFVEREGSIDDRSECTRLESLVDGVNSGLAAGVAAAG